LLHFRLEVIELYWYF